MLYLQGYTLSPCFLQRIVYHKLPSYGEAVRKTATGLVRTRHERTVNVTEYCGRLLETELLSQECRDVRELRGAGKLEL